MLLNRLRPLAIALVSACLAASVVEAEPLTPIVADWALANTEEINERLRKRIKEYATDGGELSKLADLEAADMRLYYRDNQLLMAISVKRDLPYAVKARGEKTAARVALGVLQQINTIPINDKLDEDAVRVVFIEPAALDPYSGSGPCRARGGCRGGVASQSDAVAASGGCGSNFGGTPLPFAPAGFWAAGVGSGHVSCGCP